MVGAEHAPARGPGLLAGVLADAGADVRVVRLDRGDALPEPDGLGGVVVMGGAMGVHDTDRFPWLETERRWIADAVALGVPVLGVCLGAQQLAAALGASVTTGGRARDRGGSGRAHRRGASRPRARARGRARARSIHWHGDTFDIPDGAVHLATGDRYREPGLPLRPHVYGLQFHVEVDDAMAEAWAPELPAGVSLDPPDSAGRDVGRRVLGRFVRLAPLTAGLRRCRRRGHCIAGSPPVGLRYSQ